MSTYINGVKTDPIAASTITTSGNASIGGTLGVTGATTLSSLGVTGATTIGGLALTASLLSDATYNVTTSDIAVDIATLTANRTLQLLAGATFGSQRLLFITDKAGVCDPSKVVSVTPNGVQTIDGLPSWPISQPYQSMCLKDDGTNYEVLWNYRPGGPQGYFGDAVDGDITYSVNTTLTKDVRARTVTVNAGISVDTAGFLIAATVKITIAATGKIHQNGVAAVTTTAGGKSCSEQNTSNIAGGFGGGVTAAGGVMAVAQSTATTVFKLLAGTGGAGAGTGHGAGGDNSTSFTEDFTAPHPYTTNDPTRWWPSFAYDGISAVTMVVGAGGGGGDAGGGGAGGGGAGAVRIRAPMIVLLGTIEAKGGVGGNASVTNKSGGGGGQGGQICVVGMVVGSGSFSVAGGAGGTGLGTGTSGSAGSSGLITKFL